MAAILGKSPGQLCQYRDRWGAPVIKTARGYDVHALILWMDKYGYKWHLAGDTKADAGDNGDDGAPELGVRHTPPGSLGTTSGARGRLLEAQASEREAKAELVKLRLAVERGEYVPREEIQKRDITRISLVKRGLLSLTKSAPPLLQGLNLREMEAVLEKQVRELLERFSSM